MLSVAEAERAIAEAMTDFGTEQAPLELAAGRVLRERVAAERDQPPFDRATMDGIALASSSWAAGARSFPIEGIQAAGAPALTLREPGGCVEIMTGAPLPEGADCVVPIEELTVADGAARVRDDAVVESWRYVHRRGSDYRAAAQLLAPGTQLRAPEIAVLASAGRAVVEVSRAPSVAIVSSGDELVEVDAPLSDYQIRRSNDRAIDAALSAAGIAAGERVHLRDDPAILRERLALLLGSHDVLVLSGGVSRGRYDYIPGVLDELGVAQRFHGVAQRPGKPMWFGVGPGEKPVFALPGNPVSTLVCMRRYVLPALALAMGAPATGTRSVCLESEIEFAPALAYFLPVILRDASGDSLASPRPTNTSGDFAGLAGTDGFVELAADLERFERGHVCSFYAW